MELSARRRELIRELLEVSDARVSKAVELRNVGIDFEITAVETDEENRKMSFLRTDGTLKICDF
jgi:hypothetical protein